MINKVQIKHIDVHCHLHGKEYDQDREEVLSRMKEAEVGAIVAGTDFLESKKAVELAEKHPDIWATVGQHPTDNHAEEFDAGEYRELAKSPKVVAIGECGLDYFRLRGTPEEMEVEKNRQRELFKKQLALATEIHKPLMIHCRPSGGTEDAHQEMLQLLLRHSAECRNIGISPGNVHFFTGSPEVARAYNRLGFSVSFPGVITFAPELVDSVKAAEESLILSETDSPYAAPIPHRGHRNEPTFVREVVRKIAEIRGVEEGGMAQTLLLNARKIFGLAT